MKLRQISALGAGATLLYALYEPFQLQIRRFDIYLQNLPEAAEGLRVLQISDLHAGAIQSRALLRKIIAAAQAENADLVALTGDLLSRRLSYSRFILARQFSRPVLEYAQIVARELEELRPPLGIYAVPGNHDLWNESFAPIGEILDASGIEILLNRSVRLENGLIIAGLDDLRVGNPDLSQTFAGVEPKEAQLILNHNPRLALLMASRNALILSGHTHAGQVRLPFIQVRGFPVDMGDSFFTSGFYQLDAAQLYVSRGAGTVHFPIRFRARPEIAVFTLKCAPKTT
ncbi:hypothetical protein B1R32_105172 [Abditibacterium utsteinense]|uniref:Calcineurin-like phosphoesterase domain-containing protein n=1 Tax=Abditibacterium utsteinense TaxID=1960156 RepID=A0A2S8SUL9_9BACT|nr:metallophosphoesterase [Abditibacterium utsteinense]PQV64490.1 hypothetical protein B1R32_105172 [Abditibacterium utsteinense]